MSVASLPETADETKAKYDEEFEAQVTGTVFENDVTEACGVSCEGTCACSWTFTE